MEIVRLAVEHWNETGEFDWTVVSEDVEWVVDPDAWLGDTYRGRDGIRLMLTRLAEGFDEFHLEVNEYVDAGESVVVLGRTRVRGGLSGATGGQPLAFVMRLQAGQIVAIRSYLQAEEALEAVGLRE